MEDLFGLHVRALRIESRILYLSPSIREGSLKLMAHDSSKMSLRKKRIHRNLLAKPITNPVKSEAIHPLHFF